MTGTEEEATGTCSLCGGEGELQLMDVRNEETGELKGVALCPDCVDLTVRYNRGEEVGFGVGMEDES